MNIKTPISKSPCELSGYRFFINFVSPTSNFTVMNKFLLIEGKTYPCYVNPEHITFVERKNQMTYIHLVSGEVIESVSPVEKVVSLLSQR